MPKLIDRIPENRFIGLFVGRSGTGKSVAGASFPKPLDVDDFDGRIGGMQVPWLDLNGITYDYYPPKQDGLITRINSKLDNLLTAAKLSGMSTGVVMPKTQMLDSITNQNYAFICQAIPLTHMDAGKRRGKWLGPIAMPGPEDYGMEAQAAYDTIAFFKSLPIPNILVTAHYVDRFGKSDPDNPYSESVVIGKKLSIRDKIGENIQTSFDHIFEFERDINRFYVRFRGELARTTYDWLPDGRHEWTKKPFYEWMLAFKEAKKP